MFVNVINSQIILF